MRCQALVNISANFAVMAGDSRRQTECSSLHWLSKLDALILDLHWRTLYASYQFWSASLFFIYFHITSALLAVWSDASRLVRAVSGAYLILPSSKGLPDQNVCFCSNINIPAFAATGISAEEPSKILSPILKRQRLKAACTYATFSDQTFVNSND